ncbi:hypothetical protein [Stenoxybacter acetivorans]|uniref:hypothetical protein n=1 Tax=Stenoxybacter acetivorans TaxID=422441 RepID=UPI0012EC7015|nr:hypothetical protein [Stenoxybacter acetivorans]
MNTECCRHVFPPEINPLKTTIHRFSGCLKNTKPAKVSFVSASIVFTLNPLYPNQISRSVFEIPA